MTERPLITVDAGEAVARVAYQVNEVMVIYPITPSSAMAEWMETWSAQGAKNIWGTVPHVEEMQSEAGAAGAVHGALQAGALATTFTASQGLLLMIPNMYKIAGELLPTVFHVAARSLATHALSIFGDHSDVMTIRETGFAMLASNSVQESMDMALIAHAATLKSRIPFIHFFDGFRTSHEIQRVEALTPEDIRSLIPWKEVAAFRGRAMSPDHPTLRGTAQNPDVFFQAREAINPYYQHAPRIVQECMDQLAARVGRQYHLVDYYGHREAERVLVLMGSGAEATEETVEALNSTGEKTGVLKVRLYRPFDKESFLKALPRSVRSIAVLDRTKEPGSTGEPLYLDVVTTLAETWSRDPSQTQALPVIIGGRYGLSSKEFTPAMIKGVFDELKKPSPKNHFTIGIIDDVTLTSLDYDPNYCIEREDTFRGLFYGLGADGTVSANKNSIKIIGDSTGDYVQAYFVYDSKKSGSITTSHLRAGKRPIKSSYLIPRANFVACHQFPFLERYAILENAGEGATFLLNAPYGPDTIWEHLGTAIQEEIIRKKITFYVVDAYRIARETGMGGRINTIMQTCFFAITGMLDKEDAIRKIKEATRKTFAKKGDAIIQKNFEAVDRAVSGLHRVHVPDSMPSTTKPDASQKVEEPPFVREVTRAIIQGRGDALPVSAMPKDGVFPVGTSKYEKRNIATEIPVWDENLCIQCGKCAMVCPHSVIRIKAYPSQLLQNAPPTFSSTPVKGKEWEQDTVYTIAVAPEDCTGCTLCVEVCPVKDKAEPQKKALNMHPQAPLRESGKENWEFFLKLPQVDRRHLRSDNVKGSQFLEPLFEFSGACSGCGETPYVKLVSQFFGDRMLVANATGCSSIYGGNLPTTPWTTNADGLGPAWANSLFEDNAEFGMGFRLAINKKNTQARELLEKLRPDIGDDLVSAVLGAAQKDEPEIFEQRTRIRHIREKLKVSRHEDAAALDSLLDYLVKKSVWIIGGDGWAYDIGFGGLDHVIASRENVNILVLDTEVYSNTGGQKSKATPLGAIAKFATAGKETSKKDLGLMAMLYGHVYVARIAMGANDSQTVRAILEAERYDGPSLIIAYSPCIAHGFAMQQTLEHEKMAVNSGYWPLYRYNPDLVREGKNPLVLDSKDPSLAIADFMSSETRFQALAKTAPERAQAIMAMAQSQVELNWQRLKKLAGTV